MRKTAAVLALACGIATSASAQVPARDLFVRADKGHCIACHQLPEGAGPQTRGSNFYEMSIAESRLRELRAQLETERAAEKAMKIT